MAKKISTEFPVNFVDVIHDRLEALDFHLVTKPMVARFLASDSRYIRAETPKYNYSLGNGRILYVKEYSDQVFGAIQWDLRQYRGRYICDLTQCICHPPTSFLLSELEDVPFDPFFRIRGEAVIGNGRFLPYDPDLPAATYRILASEFICAIESEALPWFDKYSNLSSLEQFFDSASYSSLTKVGFYIVIGRIVKARAEMKEVLKEKARKQKILEAYLRTHPSLKSHIDELANTSREHMEKFKNIANAKIAYKYLPGDIRERLNHTWLDDDIIERINQLTLSPEA